MENSMKGVVAVALLGGVGAIAFMVYKKKKHKAEVITMEEALAIRKEREYMALTPILEEQDSEIYVREVFDEVEIDEDEDEEEKKLRKGTDPNSESALVQYINMQTAIFRPNSNTDLVLRMLFTQPFTPLTTGDKVTYDALTASRAEFFGKDSRWAREVTWGDVILYFAERLGYNLEEDMIYWTNYILSHLSLKCNMRSEEVNNILEMLSTHAFINEDSGYFGLFGLDDDSMVDLNNRLNHAVEKKYTFEYEFQAFLKMAMREDEEDGEDGE